MKLKGRQQTGNTEILLGYIACVQTVHHSCPLVNTQSVYREELVNLTLAYKSSQYIAVEAQFTKVLQLSFPKARNNHLLLYSLVEITGMRLKESCSLHVATKIHRTMNDKRRKIKVSANVSKLSPFLYHPLFVWHRESR